MTIPIVSLLIGLLIICLVFWAARAIMSAFGIGGSNRYSSLRYHGNHCNYLVTWINWLWS